VIFPNYFSRKEAQKAQKSSIFTNRGKECTKGEMFLGGAVSPRPLRTARRAVPQQEAMSNAQICSGGIRYAAESPAREKMVDNFPMAGIKAYSL
jgi:hypothetical protein